MSIRKFLAVCAVVAAVAVPVASASAASTVVPGQQGRDGTVNGHYTDTYTYPGGSCQLVVNYRGDFGSDPYLDNGVIFNHYTCKDATGTSVFNYRIVSSDNPAYRGNPNCAEFGTWEYHTLTESGNGNVCKPGGSA
jgi:hypothetical protein